MQKLRIKHTGIYTHTHIALYNYHANNMCQQVAPIEIYIKPTAATKQLICSQQTTVCTFVSVSFNETLKWCVPTHQFSTASLFPWLLEFQSLLESVWKQPVFQVQKQHGDQARHF